MDVLKHSLKKKLKASSLMEVVIATSILLTVFAIAIFTLNNIMLSSVRQENHRMQNQMRKMMYLYKHQQIAVPFSDVKGKFEVALIKKTDKEMDWIYIIIKNTDTKKSIEKRIVAKKSENNES